MKSNRCFMIQEGVTELETANKCGGLSDDDYGKGGSPRVASFKEVTDFNHLMESARICCRGVRWKQSVQTFELDLLQWVSRLKRDLETGDYKSSGFKEFDIVERGKKRHIQAVHISERVVQKTFVSYILKPILVPKLISANGACLKGKGTGYALKRLKKDLSYAYKKYGNDFYILTMDFHNYFASIPHDIVLGMVEPFLDSDSYTLLSDFVNAFDGKRGLGLGSEISQILAVYYPNSIDHTIKERYHIKGYGRYMDDIYLIHKDKDYLRECAIAITKMANDLGISVNDNKTIISKKHFIFLKKRIIITNTGRILMRPGRSNITKMRQKIKATANRATNPGLLIQLEAAWNGYIKGLNCHYTDLNMRYLIKEVSRSVC